MHDKSPTKKQLRRQKYLVARTNTQIALLNDQLYFSSAFRRTLFVDFWSPPPERRVVLFVGPFAGTMFAENVAPYRLQCNCK